MVSKTISQVASGVQSVAPVPSVEIINGKPVVTSLQVAEAFGKNHKEVLRDLEALLAQLPEIFIERNFAQYEWEQKVGFGTRKNRGYTLTRDAFVLIAMGFTGKKALAWKVRYIEAFNAMENRLLHPRPTATLLPYQVIRTLPKPMKDRLNDLVNTKLTHVSTVHHWRARMRMWKRFNEAFRITRYELLPEVRMTEAITFLTGLDVGHGGVVTCKGGLVPLPMNAAQTTALSLEAAIEQGKALLASLSALKA